jgi:hypothetical protein
VLDLERNKSKINVIENEFKQAERAELWRQKEEQEMRVRGGASSRSYYMHTAALPIYT